MSAFIEWLESLNKRDTRVRAVLRRSLAFRPGTFPAAFPYVEPFARTDGHPREMHYLAAGLWAAHLGDEARGPGLGLGQAAARHRIASQSESVERRFVNLLDADADQLPQRLRQFVALLKEQPLDFGILLEDLVRWNHPDKPVQNRWARDFYRTSEPSVPSTETPEPKEP